MQTFTAMMISCLITGVIGDREGVCGTTDSSGQKPAVKARLDLHGDPLPEGAIARFGTVRLHPYSLLNALTFSPNGDTLVAGDWGGAIYCWDAGTGKLRKHVATDYRRIHAISPDSSTALAERYSGTISLASTSTGKEIGDLPHLEGTIRATFSANGKFVAIKEVKDTIAICEINTRKEVRRFKIPLRTTLIDISAVALSPDGKTLAAALDHGRSEPGVLWLCDVEKGSSWKWSVPEGPLSLAFSPCGKVLALGTWRGVVQLWDVSRGERIRELRGHQIGVIAVLFSPDGQTLATSAYDASIRLWRVEAGRALHVIKTLYPDCKYLAFSPDGKTLASASWSSRIQLWEVATGKERLPLDGHISTVTCVAFAPNGRILVTGGRDNTVRLWERSTGKQIYIYRGHEAAVTAGTAVTAVCFSPDGKRVASSAGKKVHVWEVSTGEQVQMIKATDRIKTVLFSPDGRFLATGEAKRIHLWDLRTGRRLHEFAGLGEQNGSFAFSPDGETLAADGDDPTIRVWDVKSGNESQRLEGCEGSVYSLKYLPDGKTLIAACTNGKIYVLDMSSRKKLRVGSWSPPFARTIFSLTLSPDGKLLVYLAGKPDEIPFPMQWPTQVFWVEPSAEDHSFIGVVDVATGKELYRLKGHEETVIEVAFSPDGRTLASVSSDTTMLLWDLMRRKESAGSSKGRR